MFIVFFTQYNMAWGNIIAKNIVTYCYIFHTNSVHLQRFSPTAHPMASKQGAMPAAQANTGKLTQIQHNIKKKTTKQHEKD